VSGHGHEGIEYYIVYLKLSNGMISDIEINRKDMSFYSSGIKGLWDDYSRYHKELQLRLL
jgi:hypothetical protein